MSVRFVAASALALFMAHAANATVYFDSTLAPLSSGGGSDGRTNYGFIAQSFTAGTADFSQVSLALTAANPADGGSVMVFLIADNGAGSLGVAGSPNLAHETLLGSISDSELSPIASLIGINFSPALAAAYAAGNPNKEYWIGLSFSIDSTAGWEYGVAAPGTGGIGLAGQSFYGSSGTILGESLGTVAESGAYSMVVDTPEPASLAILGGGLAGLGYFRRRAAKKA